MMGQLPPDQNVLFYEFCLENYVPEDHLLRQIDPLLDERPSRTPRIVLQSYRTPLDRSRGDAPHADCGLLLWHSFGAAVV